MLPTEAAEGGKLSNVKSLFRLIRYRLLHMEVKLFDFKRLKEAST
jgi:hypothetical protein